MLGINTENPDYLLDIKSESEISDVVYLGGDSARNDMTVAAGAVYVGVTDSSYYIEVTSTGANGDSFRWRKCVSVASDCQGGISGCDAATDSWSADVTVGAAGQAIGLDEGVFVSFASATGHSADPADGWCFTVDATNPIGVKDASGQRTFTIT